MEQAAPSVPHWWLIYVSLVGGAVLGWFSRMNLFERLIPVLVGRIVTSPWSAGARNCCTPW